MIYSDLGSLNILILNVHANIYSCIYICAKEELPRQSLVLMTLSSYIVKACVRYLVLTEAF